MVGRITGRAMPGAPPGGGPGPGSRGLAGLVALALLAVQSLACATAPYRFSQEVDTELTLRIAPDEEQIERGEPNWLLDGLGHYLFSLPSKILLLRWDVNDHKLSPETEALLARYLEDNDLESVKVRLNQYAPGREWRRLARNREMPAGWRYTLGVLSVLFYTILPDRLFAGLLGGDHYNPFTNTIHLFSSNPAVALHEAGHAKDFAVKRNRHWKGGYAGLRLVPLVPLWQEGVATRDALSYLYEIDESGARRTAYRSLYPAYGTYVGGVGTAVKTYVPGGPSWLGYAIAFGPVAVGHVLGQTRALFVRDRGLPEATDPGPEGSGRPGEGSEPGESATGSPELEQPGPEGPPPEDDFLERGY